MSTHVQRNQLNLPAAEPGSTPAETVSDLDKTTRELARTNLRLTQEMDERKKAEDSLLSAFSQMKRLKDRLQAENLYLQQEAAQEHNFGELIGQSSALSQLHQAVQWVAPMLLGLIQTGELERMGNPLAVKVDLRIIASSSRDLEQEARCGRFREDLLARLKVFLITTAPLRKRKEDIPPLVDHFVAKYSRKIGKSIETVAKETMDSLGAYSWPGNVLELESVIKRAVTASRGTTLRVLDRFETPGHGDPGLPEDMMGLIELEQDHIIHVLEKTGWRIEGKSGAAALLGLNPSTLRGRMRKHGILRRFVIRD